MTICKYTVVTIRKMYSILFVTMFISYYFTIYGEETVHCNSVIAYPRELSYLFMNEKQIGR